MSLSSDERVLRPRPKQMFFTLDSSSDTPDLSDSRTPPLPAEASSPGLRANSISDDTPTSPPARSRSILNLTSSTLFGIFGQSDYAPDRDDTTPFGTGALTPSSPSALRDALTASGLGLDEASWQQRSARRRSMIEDESVERPKAHTRAAGAQQQRGGRVVRRTKMSVRGTLLPALGKTLILSAVGWGYGHLISHLHDRQQIAPLRIDSIPHYTTSYLGFWVVVANIVGWTMPIVDRLWEEDGGAEQVGGIKRTKSEGRRGSWAPEWSDAVRSIGAFVGVAFAIKKLPWQSTMQLSLTLALLNPTIWFLLDRSPPGLVYASTLGIAGTVLCLATNPDIIPAPASSARAAAAAVRAAGGAANASQSVSGVLIPGVLSTEEVAIATWIASVLFFSAVLFGNIGRRL